MKTLRQCLLVFAASAVMAVGAHAQTLERLQTVIRRDPGNSPNSAAQSTNYSGTVTDAAGHPLAGATVEYWRYEGIGPMQNHLELKQKVTTGTNGVFELPVSPAVGFLLARKPGLAPAWRQLGQPFNTAPGTEPRLLLTSPGALAGAVVDETDQPVTGAVVEVVMAATEIPFEGGGPSFNFFNGPPARDCFTARTDAAGHFRIDGFPTNASAILTVQSPGKVLRPTGQEFGGPGSGYRTDQTDIKLVVEPAASVEGKIVAGESGPPVPVAQLSLQAEGRGFFGAGEREPVQSGADGTFRFNDVAAGSYQLHAVFGTNPPTEWVAEAVPVSVEPGQTVREVTVTATRGAMLEVAVFGTSDRKPQTHVSVNAYKESFHTAASTDSNGVAQLRLPPGDYQLYAALNPGTSAQGAASVEAGRTNHVEIELAGPQKVTGLVRGPDGRPAAGLPVRLIGPFGPETASARTDTNGQFEMELNRQRFGQSDFTPCVLICDVDHNLAAAQEIDEDSGALELKLEPALTLAGRAACDGKPVTNTAGTLIFWTGRSGMHLTGLSRGTNTPGCFEIPALPPGRKYGVIVSAPGYGQKSVFDINASAEAGRQELDPVELLPANLKLAGQVLDADDKPAADIYVHLSGENQPSASTRTGRDGHFHFESVCDGRAQVSASSRNAYGNTSAEGGDTNVVLHLGQTFSGRPDTESHKLKGTVTDPDGRPAAGAQVAVFPASGMRWNRTGSNGVFNLTWSLQPWQLQSGGALLVVRDSGRNLAAVEELPEETTNLDVKLKPALTVRGLVKGADDAPLAGAQVGVWLKAGNSYDQLNDQLASTDAQGRYELKCLPADGQYIVFASAKGHGRSQQSVQSDSETNGAELAPLVLKVADRLVAGQVLNEKDKPVSGVNVSLNGEDQPNGYIATDSNGRFHFQVCEGQVQLYASSQSGFAQAMAEAGDTNVVMTLSSRSGNPTEAPRRTALKGGPLPDLTTVKLAADAAPANQPVLLCLFDASQRPSRHVIHLLEQRVAALRQKGVIVLGIQAAVISDEVFNAWKSAGPVSFPIGRVTEQSEKSRWAVNVTALPWLILADTNHRVVAEGFALDDLDDQIQKLPK
ncbi:MAG TPA: carboxypeptidase regulatory-like domain-containing protein [Candidatus Acidoferrum sp.]|nr:carboxypeptidase regulatory-like domain-containing protein [Candidatus Acidoferrum sp.]